MNPLGKSNVCQTLQKTGIMAGRPGGTTGHHAWLDNSRDQEIREPIHLMHRRPTRGNPW